MTTPLSDEMSDSQRRLIMSLALNDLQTKVSEHDKLLVRGNGEPSLMERIRKIEEFVKEFRYWQKFLIGALILQTFAFLFGVMIALIRFLPVLERLAGK